MSAQSGAVHQRPLVDGLSPGSNQPVYLRQLDPPTGYTHSFAGLAHLLDLGLIEPPEPASEEPSIHDDRVLEPAETCAHCPADAVQEGLCHRHLHEYRQELCGDGRP